MKITKEQYEQIKGLYGRSLEEKVFELNLVSAVDICGYGIKEIKAYQKDGEYYFDYTTYDSCD